MDIGPIVLEGFQTLLDSYGVDVTYDRGGMVVNARAVRGRYGENPADDFRPTDTSVDTDWLFLATDIMPTFGEPERGDIISAKIRGASRTFQVQPPDGELEYRLSDPSETILRIHTRSVDVSYG